MTVRLCLSCSLGLLNRRPWAHSAGCWLSLLHLISIFSGPQLIRTSRLLRPDVAFLITSRLQLAGTLTGNSTGPLGVELNWNRNSIQLARRTQLSFFIVRRPFDLWNRMFNRHQAEITVMQLRSLSSGASLCSVPWEFFWLVPFHQTISAHAISSHNCH